MRSRLFSNEMFGYYNAYVGTRKLNSDTKAIKPLRTYMLRISLILISSFYFDVLCVRYILVVVSKYPRIKSLYLLCGK